jgi:uncharacterized protein YecT (DUF1311 family)
MLWSVGTQEHRPEGIQSVNYNQLIKAKATLRRFIFVLFLVSIFSSGLVPVCDAQSQTDINLSAANDFKKADAELNKVYNKIKVSYKTKTLFLKRLQEVQLKWMAFRDAELEALYPTDGATDKEDAYGSAYSLCRSNWLTKLTIQRTKELKRWLDGIAEGDVCCGSIRVK